MSGFYFKIHHVLLLVLGGVLSASPAVAAACGGHGTRGSMLVSTTWLSQHSPADKLVIFAVGKPEEFAAGHIPGSVYLDAANLRKGAPSTSGAEALTLELPSPEQAENVLSKAGVNNETHIVLYSTGDNATMTARMYLTLDAMGLGGTTSILDGGLTMWRREARPLTQEVPVPSPGNLRLCPQNDVIATLDDVRTRMGKPNIAIVDARLPEFYSGEKIPPQRRAGHIPGAINIPFASLLDENGRILPPSTLQGKFEAAGARPGEQVITYCHIGQQASLAYFVARYLGYDSRMFDGSWQEWSAHTELPAETSRGVPEH